MDKVKLNRRRHIVKTLTWRVIASLDTLLIAWLISEDIKIGASIASLEVLTKMVLYYFHERAWYKHIKFGLEEK